MDNSKVVKIIKAYLFLTLGCFLYAFAWECFMIPNGMSSGGLMGLCTVVEYATGGSIKASYSFIVVNSLLILASILVFGIGFGFRTIYCILLSTAMLGLLGNTDILKALPDHFFYISQPVLVPIVAGVIEAFGIGMILREGGSSGGTDIIALVVNKYYPVSLSKVFLLCDLFIITSLLFLPDRAFNDMLYGYEMMFTFSMMIDFVVVGQKSSFQLMIFSQKYDEIADYINKELDRGATILKAQGWFTKKERNVLLVLLTRKELPVISSVVKNIDDKAFMSISPVSNVYGEGFEEIKGGIRRKKNIKK
ncbi:MAG: YitT family protein [Bacteroidales bacterium]|nr:YitT family protein [Bacteroidales bacterium]